MNTVKTLVESVYGAFCLRACGVRYLLDECLHRAGSKWGHSNFRYPSLDFADPEFNRETGPLKIDSFAADGNRASGQRAQEALDPCGINR